MKSQVTDGCISKIVLKERAGQKWRDILLVCTRANLVGRNDIIEHTKLSVPRNISIVQEKVKVPKF